LTGSSADEIIRYLREENRALTAQLRNSRMRLTDANRRRLAAAGAPLGRRLLTKVATIVTADTILRWHRHLIARKWTYSRRRLGRPGVPRDSSAGGPDGVRESELGLYPPSGCVEESGASRGAVDDRHDPQAARDLAESCAPTSWQTFLRAHWGALVGADFFTTEVWTLHGLVTYYTVFVIEWQSRRVHILGSTPHPNEAFMLQIARQFTDPTDRVGDGPRVLICDRDQKWSTAVRQLLETSGVRASSRHRIGRPTAMRTRSGLFAHSKRNA
jgi:hypothetical protein